MSAGVASESDVQALCEVASQKLVATDYIAAERLLERAKSLAMEQQDFDTLARLMFPLQEARRQKRQRCGEGVVRFDLVCRDAAEACEAVRHMPHGQLLIRGPASTAPAEAARRLVKSEGWFVDVLLGADFPLAGGGVLTAVFPRPADLRTLAVPTPLEVLLQRLPPHVVTLNPAELPAGPRPGTAATFARVMDIFERLHRPFLAMADAMPVSAARLSAYDEVLAVDYACELAHQNAAEVARELARRAGD
ncbi:MAG: hypothetical protein ACK4PI_01640 [Tepidisphaerales bacterium]